MLTTLEGQHFSLGKKECQPTNAFLARILCGHPSARYCAHCLRKTRSILNGSSRTALNGPEVNQTKPEHHLTVRSVQIARGTRLRLSPSLRCHVEHPLEHAHSGNLCFFEHECRWLEEWWSQTGSNRRPEACKATALPAELWPQFRSPCWDQIRTAAQTYRPTRRQNGSHEEWWAWEDLNFRPHAYQARALTN